MPSNIPNWRYVWQASSLADSVRVKLPCQTNADRLTFRCLKRETITFYVHTSATFSLTERQSSSFLRSAVQFVQSLVLPSYQRTFPSCKQRCQKCLFSFIGEKQQNHINFLHLCLRNQSNPLGRSDSHRMKRVKKKKALTWK